MCCSQQDPAPAGRSRDIGPHDARSGGVRLLLDGIQACVDAGRSRSTDPAGDATAVWIALHGYVSLMTGAPDFPWPPGDHLIDTLIDRLALLE